MLKTAVSSSRVAKKDKILWDFQGQQGKKEDLSARTNPRQGHSTSEFRVKCRVKMSSAKWNTSKKSKKYMIDFVLFTYLPHKHKHTHSRCTMPRLLVQAGGPNRTKASLFFFYSKHCEAAGIHIRRASNHKLSPSGVFLMSSRHQVPTGKHTCTVSWYCLKLEAPTPRNEPQEDVRYASSLLWSQCFFGDYGLSH